MSIYKYDPAVRLVLFSLLLVVVFYVVVIVTSTHQKVSEMRDMIDNAIVLEQPYEGE